MQNSVGTAHVLTEQNDEGVFLQNVKPFFLLSGLGMYESPLFLATHEEESGGRSVPTTPLQVAAPGICLCQSDMKGSVLCTYTATLFISTASE